MHNIGCLRTCEAGTLVAGTSAVCSKWLIFAKGGRRACLELLNRRSASRIQTPEIRGSEPRGDFGGARGCASTDRALDQADCFWEHTHSGINHRTKMCKTDVALWPCLRSNDRSPSLRVKTYERAQNYAIHVGISATLQVERSLPC